MSEPFPVSKAIKIHAMIIGTDLCQKEEQAREVTMENMEATPS